jgi:hypothetical protein
VFSSQDEIVSNHDELMCNFFAQADALAYGKSREELRAQNVPDYLIPHRSFTGANDQECWVVWVGGVRNVQGSSVCQYGYQGYVFKWVLSPIH